jgi:pyrroline-5-carboxylate reductase
MGHSIGFLGGGRISAIFLEAWESNRLDLSHVLVSDSNPAVLDRLKGAHDSITVTTDNLGPAGQDIVFLALHPPVMKAALPDLVPALKAEATIVSLAPVLTFAKLEGLLKGHNRLVRMIPNAPSLLGQGYNPVAFGPGSLLEDRSRLAPLFAALGQAPEVPENHLEAYAILTAMGPTYFWPQWQMLRELAVSFGLDAEAADRGLLSMLHGAADLLFADGRSFEAVMDTIPVKPLAEAQESLLAPFREKLPALHARLTAH